MGIYKAAVVFHHSLGRFPASLVAGDMADRSQRVQAAGRYFKENGLSPCLYLGRMDTRNVVEEHLKVFKMKAPGD